MGQHEGRLIGPTRTARDRDDRVTDIIAREAATRPEGRPSRLGPGARQPGREIACLLRRQRDPGRRPA